MWEERRGRGSPEEARKGRNVKKGKGSDLMGHAWRGYQGKMEWCGRKEGEEGHWWKARKGRNVNRGRG